MRQHDLYRTGDPDAPSAVKDRNGEVVLDMCRVCNEGEATLAPTCPGMTKRASFEITAAVSGLDAFERELAKLGATVVSWVKSETQTLEAFRHTVMIQRDWTPATIKVSGHGQTMTEAAENALGAYRQELARELGKSTS